MSMAAGLSFPATRAPESDLEDVRGPHLVPWAGIACRCRCSNRLHSVSPEDGVDDIACPSLLLHWLLQFRCNHTDARRERESMSRQTKVTAAYLGIQLGLPSLVLGAFFGIYAIVSHLPGSPLDWMGYLSCLAMLAFPFLIGTAAYYATLWHKNFMAGLVEIHRDG